MSSDSMFAGQRIHLVSETEPAEKPRSVPHLDGLVMTRDKGRDTAEGRPKLAGAPTGFRWHRLIVDEITGETVSEPVSEEDEPTKAELAAALFDMGEEL